MLRDIIFFSIVGTVLYLMHAVVYVTAAAAFGFHIPFWYLWLVPLALSFILAFIGVRRAHGRLTSLFFWLTSSLVGTVFLLMCASMVYVPVRLVLGEQPLALAGLLSMATLLALYALWNGNRLVVRSYTIPLAALAEPMRVIHLSDIHMGTVRGRAYVEELVRRCNALEPDLVLISGDLFDGSAPLEGEILKAFDASRAPVYLSYGNHELYEGLEEVKAAVAESSVTLLDNRTFEHPLITLIGVNDRQTLGNAMLGDVLDTITWDASKPTILLYHTPVEWDLARERGIDIMLSGHTHNGQIVPFNFLVKLFHPYTTGLFTEGEHYLHVSPGTGTWGPPMRLGSNNQITVLELLSDHS